MVNTIKNESDIVKKFTQENLTLKEDKVKLKQKIIKLETKIIKCENKNAKLQKENRILKDKIAMQESYAERIKRIRAET